MPYGAYIPHIIVHFKSPSFIICVGGAANEPLIGRLGVSAPLLAGGAARLRQTDGRPAETVP